MTLKPEQPARASPSTPIDHQPFADCIDAAPEDARPVICRLLARARGLEDEGLIELATCIGRSGRSTLLPRFRDERVGLVTIWNDGGAYVSLWRSVFERRCPDSVETVEQPMGDQRVGQGNTAADLNDDLLDALAAAYHEGNGG